MRVGKTIVMALAVLAVAAGLFAGCATYVPAETQNPFALQLDRDWHQRRADEIWLGASVGGVAVGVGGATTFQTLGSLQTMDQGAAQTASILSYVWTALSIGSAIWAFIDYNKATDDYLGTLRRETDYYNLLDPPGGEGESGELN